MDLEEARNNVDDKHFMEIKYEHFCQNPIDVFRKTAKFCELNWSKKFEKNLSEFKLTSQDFKWKEDFTNVEISELEVVLGQHLKRYG